MLKPDQYAQVVEAMSPKKPLPQESLEEQLAIAAIKRLYQSAKNESGRLGPCMLDNIRIKRRPSNTGPIAPHELPATKTL